jgi:Rrf2 family protein
MRPEAGSKPGPEPVTGGGGISYCSPPASRALKASARPIPYRNSKLRCWHHPPTISRVKLSVKSDYAARAVLGLARHHPQGEAVRVEDLAAEQGIPANYLVQILIELKAQGIARSVRGKAGGYLLGRSPADITLGDVLHAIHGSVFDTPALNDPECPPELRSAWQNLQQTLKTAASAITFQRLLDQSAEKEKMYYI